MPENISVSTKGTKFIYNQQEYDNLYDAIVERNRINKLPSKKIRNRIKKEKKKAIPRLNRKRFDGYFEPRIILKKSKKKETESPSSKEFAHMRASIGSSFPLLEGGEFLILKTLNNKL